MWGRNFSEAGKILKYHNVCRGLGKNEGSLGNKAHLSRGIFAVLRARGLKRMCAEESRSRSGRRKPAI